MDEALRVALELWRPSWLSPLGVYQDAGPVRAESFAIGGHTIAIVPHRERATMTGRRRYFVECVTCDRVLHEATTGPYCRVEQHLDGDL